MSTWLVLDANNLCWKSFFVMGDLSHKGAATGVIFGFLRDIQILQREYGTTHTVFAFDYGRSKRYDLYPGYKATREVKRLQLTRAEREAQEELRRQIDDLRSELLFEIGYRNIFYQDGYEADDIIASVCKNLPEGDEAIVVSTDKDLLQLINKRVKVHTSKGLLDKRTFVARWGVPPSLWADVKAMAGCPTDDITGIAGVGEKTAAKFLAGELKRGTKTYEKCERGSTIWQRNLEVVKLPLPGVKQFRLREDRLSRDGWKNVVKRLGFKSLPGPFKMAGVRS